MLGIDTITLTSNEFSVRHSASLTIQDRNRSMKGEKRLDYSDEPDYLFTDDLGKIHRGAKAFMNLESGGDPFAQLTINQYGLKIQSSLPRIIDDGDNSKGLQAKYVGQALKSIQSRLASEGVLVDLASMNVSRIDVPKTEICTNQFDHLATLIPLFKFRNSKIATFGNSYLREGNKTNQLCFYVKDPKEQAYRLEARVLNREGVKAMSKKIGEITPTSLQDHDLLNGIYSQVAISRINLKATEREYLSSTDMKLMLEYQIQKESERLYMEVNAEALQIMEELTDVTMRTKNLTSTQRLDIMNSVLFQFIPQDYIELAEQATLKEIERTMKGPSKRMAKKRFSERSMRQQPSYTSDLSKESIYKEFTEKFLTI